MDKDKELLPCPFPEHAKVYIVEVSDDLHDYGEWYVETKCYASNEAAEKRAETVRGEIDDGIRSYAHVRELEVVR